MNEKLRRPHFIYFVWQARSISGQESRVGLSTRIFWRGFSSSQTVAKRSTSAPSLGIHFTIRFTLAQTGFLRPGFLGNLSISKRLYTVSLGRRNGARLFFRVAESVNRRVLLIFLR